MLLLSCCSDPDGSSAAVRRVFAALTAGVALAAVLPVHASGLEEVRVTAQKRSQALADVPATVAVFSEHELDRRGVDELAELQHHLPGLSVQRNRSPFSSALRIRGIGNEGNIPNFEPAVALYVDGAYRSRTGLGLGALVEIERIEVLKGPQSTLYGKNATAGVVHLITPKPNLEHYTAGAELTLGRFNETGVRGWISGPVSDSAAFRVAGLSRRRDGWLDNRNAGADDPNEADQQSLRGQWLWAPSADFSLRLIAADSRRDMTCCSPDVEWSPGGIAALELATGRAPADTDGRNRVVDLPMPHTFEDEAGALTVIAEYRAPFATLTSISAYDEYELRVRSESSYSPLDLMRQNDPQTGDTLSQELRLNSNDGGSLDWLAGLYFLETAFERGGTEAPLLWAGRDWSVAGPALAQVARTGGDPLRELIAANTAAGDTSRVHTTTDTDSAGVFSQVDWHARKNLTLSAGARYLDEEKRFHLTQSSIDADGVPLIAVLADSDPANDLRAASLFNVALGAPGTLGNTDGHYTTDAWTWNLSASWRASAGATVFATASEGFKSGGFNGGWGKRTLDGNATGPAAFLVPEQAEDRRFNDEHVRHYEAGVKTASPDRHLLINAAAFRSDYEDLQVASFTGLNFVVTNAEDAVVQGVEVDGSAVVGENLRLDFAATWLDAEYRRHEDGTCRNAQGVLGNCSGTRVPFTPEYEVHLGSEYNRQNYYARLDVHWSDGYPIADVIADGYQDAYTLVGLRAGWRNGRFDIGVWGRNLTDETVQIVAAPQPVYGGVLRYLREPRTYGITAKVQF